MTAPRTYLVAVGDLTLRAVVEYAPMGGWIVAEVSHAAGDLVLPSVTEQHNTALGALAATLGGLGVDPTRVEVLP